MLQFSHETIYNSHHYIWLPGCQKCSFNIAYLHTIEFLAFLTLADNFDVQIIQTINTKPAIEINQSN